MSFLAGVFIAAAVYWSIWPDQPEFGVQNETHNWSRLSDEALVQKLKESSLDEVKSFVKAEMDHELPANYVIPAHIANARNSGQAVSQVNREYTVFPNVKGDDFLRAVQEDPIRYREYLNAHKAIRKRFNTE